MLRASVLFAAAVMLLGAGVAARASACSQCLCGSPTPPGYLLSYASKQFTYGVEDRYLAKRNALDDAVGNEQQSEHRISGLLMFRPLARLALQARLPYVLKVNTREAVGAPHGITRSHGLGDADILARFDAWHFGNLFTRRGTLAAVAGVTMPTGSNEARDAAGQRLEAHLQPGSGAWSGSLGVAADASFLSSALSASVIGRWNGANAHGFQYGDVLLFNLGYARTLRSSWETALELNGRTAARDRTEGGAGDPNSGGTVLYAAPSVRWSALASVAVEFLVQIPIAQALNGIQTEKPTGRLGLVRTAP